MTMTFAISILRTFTAEHQLHLLDGSLEPLHSHNWQVRVTVGADNLDAIGTVMDFHELQGLVDAVLESMSNRNLNDLAQFETVNPSAENVALHIAGELKLPNNIRL